LLLPGSNSVVESGGAIHREDRLDVMVVLDSYLLLLRGMGGYQHNTTPGYSAKDFGPLSWWCAA